MSRHRSSKSIALLVLFSGQPLLPRSCWIDVRDVRLSGNKPNNLALEKSWRTTRGSRP